MAKGSRGGKRAGSSKSLEDLGLKRENNIDEGLFNFTDGRYGNYAQTLAQDINELADDSQTILSMTKGNNKAYAVIEPDTDTLEAIISTGGGTGTQMLSNILQYQQGQGKGLSWMVDNKASESYYDSMGLGKFKTNNNWYDIKPENMKEVIKLVNKKVRSK